jgi:hypothetical protein
MSVHIQKTTNTPYQLELSASVSVSGGGWDGNSNISRDFGGFTRSNTTIFDSTIVIKVYSNTTFGIHSTLRVNPNPASQSKGFAIKASDYKTKPLDILFN